MFPVFVKVRFEKVGGTTPALFYFDAQRVKRLSKKILNSPIIHYFGNLLDRSIILISKRSPKEILVSLQIQSCYTSRPA